ncbi:hypothetical protein LCGC14_0160390 [marine sediment metagenome]|uniref:Calcineurin-like phosphoesterase domain-containing protein n=1 Tax=marine sediment metagenome TaxID=412755 RepID=A0A0F9VBC7_9ZZZZ|nr:metallophosphoesterase [Candidatus Nealsonbacteria bacterium]
MQSKTIKIERFSIEIKNLPPSFRGVKIAHLSDLHSKNFSEKENKVLEILQSLNPDFIFITGDFINETTKDLESCQNFWKKLSESYSKKVFGVLGNHDHYHPQFKIINNLLEESGIKILENEAVILRRNEDFIHPIRKLSISNGVYLIGVDDPHEGYDDVEKAMAGIEAGASKILIAHSPEIFRKVKGKGVDLVLVGHTHGGQINIPFITNLLLPLKYDKKYKSGLFEENSTFLYVSRGIGTTLLPIRFNAPPEIALIELK